MVLLTWLPRLVGPLDLRWDGGVYYVLGTSLAEGKGYRLLNEPGEIQATQYPPLFPGLIALHQLLAGTDDPTLVGRGLRLTFLLFSLIMALACYALFRGYVSPIWAFLGAAAFMLHTSTVFVSDIAFAEVPFALATILFFIVLKRGTSRRHEASAGLLAIVACLLRTTGVALLVAWVADGFLRRRPGRALFRLALVLPAVAGWQLYIASVERGSSYTAPSYTYQRADYLFYNVSYARNVRLREPENPEAGRLSLAGLAERLTKNLSTVPLRAGETVSALRADWRKQITRFSRIPILGKPLANLVLALLGSLVLVGLTRQFLGGDYVIPLYALIYIGGVCVTPWTHLGRYWFPLAPMMMVGLYHFVTMVGQTLAKHAWHGTRRWARHAVLGGVAFVLLIQVASVFDFFRIRHQPVVYLDRRGERVSYRLFYYRDTYRALDAALDGLRESAEPGAIVAASMPHWVYLRTGLKAVMPPFERDPARALDLLETVPITYLIVDGRSGSFTRVFGLPAVRQAPERWESVFVDQNGEVETFRRSSW